ncbi:hypothetical protein DM860_008465 [Cuscuta australis]|uniref:valine--tRNA ligase n=1 Tax=Cuscuta australis TaxID=267555 RepID=A0A328D4Q4_9ASTE|nr:hypothetical protein DM860_008465 [Cuscuta australis]
MTQDGIMQLRELTLEELERKKKKEEKAQEKELKKLKAAQKAEAAKLQAQQTSGANKAPKKKNAKRDTGEENPEDFLDPHTPFGQKKQLSRLMAKAFNPSAVEKAWYSWWEKSNFFVADPKSSKPPFVILLPPPNVTGELHIGHALTAALQDVLVRWRRMSGFNVLWVPGTDHAGIATQVKVEEKIMHEKQLKRRDIGREEFLSEAWKWKEKCGGTILKQLRQLGASLDWSREVRIPAWYLTLDDDELKDFGAYNNHWVIARTEQEAQQEARKVFDGKNFQLTQDPDVLDTWFSSGLFPLSVLGWPDNTDDLIAFYPTSLLETGHDILFFWVARMVMLGIKLGGDMPFGKVYLHPLIRDAHGRKISKSLGNAIDPLDVINGITLEGLHKKLEKRLEEGHLDPNGLKVAKEEQTKDFPNGIPECGADALRFALVSYTAQSDKIYLDILRVVGYRQWCNKLWNAIRFAMSKLGDDYTPPSDIVPNVMPFSCQWILSVLNKAVSKTVSSLEAYEFSDETTAVHHWWQYQLCDVFIEVIKPYFASSNPEFASAKRYAQDTMWICLDNGLRLLHPFMPFVTEELWQRLPSRNGCKKESIMISDYPSSAEDWTNDDVECEMNLVESVVKELRSLRSLIPNKERLERRVAFVRGRVNDDAEIIIKHELEIKTLGNLSSLEVLKEKDAVPAGCVVGVVNEALSVFLKTQGAIDVDAEREKLKKRMDDIKKLHDNLSRTMSASGYKEKVKSNVHEENVARLASCLQELSSLEEASQHLERESAKESNGCASPGE